MSAHQSRPLRTIWILEDDSSMQFLYEEMLKTSFILRLFDSIDDLLAAVRAAPKHPDLLLADLRLKDGNFLESLEEKKLKTILPPFFVISSMEDIGILRRCFESGALDYLVKPFSKVELSAKVERFFSGALAASHGSGARTARSLMLPITVHPGLLKVERHDNRTTCQLTARELQLFSTLFEAEEHTATRDAIIRKVWDSTHVSEKAFDVHLYNLRQKLRRLGIQVMHLGSESYQLTEI